MSFLTFVLLVVLGYVFVHTRNFFVKLLGVALFIVAFNPLSKMITGKSIQDNISIVWHAGENLYNKSIN